MSGAESSRTEGDSLWMDWEDFVDNSLTASGGTWRERSGVVHDGIIPFRSPPQLFSPFFGMFMSRSKGSFAEKMMGRMAMHARMLKRSR